MSQSLVFIITKMYRCICVLYFMDTLFLNLRQRNHLIVIYIMGKQNKFEFYRIDQKLLIFT